MNKVTNKLIPELRFPEFENEGEWKECTIESMGNVVTGGTPSKEDKEYWDGDFIWITAQDFKAKYIYDSVLKLTQKGRDKSRVIPKNSVLVTCIASIGLNAINKVDCVTNQQINSIICNSENHFEFIYYSISKNGNRLKNLAGQTAVPIINKSVFEKFTIHKPSSPNEQQKIASCLSSIEEVIVAHSQKLEALKEHKKGLMQNLFPQEGETVPKYRFPEFVNDGEWVENKLEKYIVLFSGIALKSEELSDDESGIPILRGINITEGYIRHSKEIDKYFVGEIENLKNYLIKENDIVIGMDGSKVGKNVALIKKEDENSILIQRVARIRTNEKSDIIYIYQHFMSYKFIDYVDTVNTSSGIPHISAQQIKDFKLGFPPKLKEQQKIAECLFSLDTLITAQAEEIEQLKLHKNGLMQGLFPKINNLI